MKNGSLEGKTILLVNTGSIKKRFIIQRLKKLGLNLIVLNKEKNWATPYVDEWIIADTYNHTEVIEAVSRYLENNPILKPQAIITFWEDDVLLTSKLVEKFNFIGIPYKIAKHVRNKFLFREFCSKHEIPTPKCYLINSKNNYYEILEALTFPVIIKPVYGSSGAYVVKVEDKTEFIETVDNITNNITSNVETALADGVSILAEEYIDGDEVDIDIIVQNGKIKFSSISDNYNKSNGSFFIDKGQSIPSSLPLNTQNDLLQMAEDTLEKLGIFNGCIHYEAKSTKKGPMPLEVNLRMGGDYVYSYTKSAWNVDLIELAVEIALGNLIKIHTPETPKNYVIGWDLHPETSGLLVELDIDKQLTKKYYLDEIYISKKIGDAVLLPPEGWESIGWITVIGDNLLDAQDNLKDALDHIHFSIVKFNAGSSFGKTSRKNRFSVALLKKEMLLGAARFATINSVSEKNPRKLHVGIACNKYEKMVGTVENDLSSVGDSIQSTLIERGYKTSYFDFNNLTKVFGELQKSNVDIVFNLCERINDSSLLEPHAAAILDTLQIPYTGSNLFTLGLAIDKIRVKKLLTYHEIPTAKWDYIYTVDEAIRTDLKYPLIIKPANTDNSIGITNDSVVTCKKDLLKQIAYVIETLKSPALIEEYIDGDEYDVSILGDDENDLRVLPLSRSIFDKMPKDKWHIYTFDTKFGDIELVDRGIFVQRPVKNISKKLESLISEIALDTYNILDCHDYGRVEIRVDKQNNPFVLELNPNPSIGPTDCLPSVAKLIGMDYGDFIEEIIRMAINRYKNNSPYYHLKSNLI